MALLELTIGQYHQAIRAGGLTCAGLVDFYLARIQKYDHRLKSIISINPDARSQAQALDWAFQHDGTWAGVLHGVPILLKDNIETAALPTTAGSCSLNGWQPGNDAPLVQRLKQAGAIILAKTNLHEFAIWGETISSIKGQTLNPYDLTRTPGGSSGGTGAALAANFGLGGIGTDTVNSIRSPASANNLVGLRPTLGTVSRDGIVPYALTQDTAGAMARTVEDVWLIHQVIADADIDSATPERRALNALTSLPQNALQGRRLGVLPAFFGSQVVNAVMQPALHQLTQAGASLVDVPDAVDSTDLAQTVSVHLYELRQHLNSYLAGRDCPVKSLQEIIDGGLFHPGIKETLLKANALGMDDDDYRQRLQKQHEIKAWLIALFASLKLDGLVYPHQQQLVCKVGGSQQQRNGVLAAVSGLPSICVPAGFSCPTADAPLGVPVGMEILGLPGSDSLLLAMACAFELVKSHRLAPQETSWEAR